MISSPTLPTIRVDFGKVNAFALSKLPKPELLAVHSCRQDEEFYSRPHGYGCFGMMPGLRTSLGVIAPPTDPIHGHVYVGGYGEHTKYVLHADAA